MQAAVFKTVDGALHVPWWVRLPCTLAVSEPAAREELAEELEGPVTDLAADVEPGRTSAIAALRYRDFRLFWFGLRVSNIGTWMQMFGQGYLVVLLAVVAHDFADGLNTVTFMLATRNSRWRTGALLGIDAIAPVLGALCAGLLNIAPRVLAFQLSFFAGFLLYLGASDLLPQVHARTRGALIAATIAGGAVAGLLVFALQAPA